MERQVQSVAVVGLLAVRGDPKHIGPIEQTSFGREDPTQVVVVLEHVQVVDVLPQAI